MKNDTQRTHVYFMPGMAASPKIFEHIHLPEDEFKVHWLKWELPGKEETLLDYVKRISCHVEYENSVLLGVSFGGVIVQEMMRYLNPKRVILVSSVKTKNEFPYRMRFARATGIHKLLPTSLVKHIAPMSKWPLGKTVKKRLSLYKRYIGIEDKVYMDWALDRLLTWDRNVAEPGLIHIHGESDMILPIKYIRGCIRIPNATHIMIINKYRWFNRHLPELIFNGKTEG